MKKRKKKNRTAGIVIFSVCAGVIVLLLALAAVFVLLNLNKIDKVVGVSDVVPPEQEYFDADATEQATDSDGTGPAETETKMVSVQEIDWAEIEPFLDDDLINILLIGQDRREGQARQRSDSMILCSINPDTKQISMISFLRDLYVQIPGGYSDNRLNAAYAFGGFPLLCDTLFENFGVTVDGCFEVDFSGFENVIEQLGGVDVELTGREAQLVGVGAEAGVYHLDGRQALSYSRIRKIDSDFGRTQRQRNVLQSIYEKFRTADVQTLMKLLGEILPYLSTDMTNSQIMLLAAKCIPLLSAAELSSYRVPADDAFYYATIRGMSVIVPDLERIHEELENEYLPLG